jgi:hypothetical protein
MISDWFFVVDFDELPYHPGGVRVALERCDALGVTVAPICEGWDMIADGYPDPARPITDQVRSGVRSVEMDKLVAFRSGVCVQYGAGAHDCELSGCVAMLPDAPRMKLLHYKWLGQEYVHDKAVRCRLSPRNHLMRWGYKQGVEQRYSWVDYWRDGMIRRQLVL